MAATGYEKDIDLPGPRPRPGKRGTLLQHAREIPADELVADGNNRLTAGITWLPWGDIDLRTEAIGCNVVYSKEARDLPHDMYQAAFLIYDALTCNNLSGMLDELWRRLDVNFGVGLSAAFARQLEFAADGGLGLQGASNYDADGTDYVPNGAGGSAVSLRVAMNNLEMYLATRLMNGTGMIHMTPGLFALAVADELAVWDGTDFRTATGHIVVGDAGHTGLSTPSGGAQGTAAAPWIYATGDVWWAVKAVPKLEEAESGNGYQLIKRNIDRPMFEVAGLLAFDPTVLGAARVTVA